jgi:hypothetical protein
MALAIVVGALIGYCWKEREHAREIEAILRITRRIEAAEKERAPKGPEYAVVRTADGREYRARLPLQPC